MDVARPVNFFLLLHDKRLLELVIYHSGVKMECSKSLLAVKMKSPSGAATTKLEELLRITIQPSNC